MQINSRKLVTSAKPISSIQIGKGQLTVVNSIREIHRKKDFYEFSDTISIKVA